MVTNTIIRIRIIKTGYLPCLFWVSDISALLQVPWSRNSAEISETQMMVPWLPIPDRGSVYKRVVKTHTQTTKPGTTTRRLHKYLDITCRASLRYIRPWKAETSQLVSMWATSLAAPRTPDSGYSSYIARYLTSFCCFRKRQAMRPTSLPAPTTVT